MNGVVVYLLRYWNGNLPLGKAFLNVFLPITILWWITKTLTSNGQELIISNQTFTTIILITIYAIFGFGTGFYRAIGLWRCSKNSNHPPSILGAKLVAGYVFIMTFIGASIALWATLSSFA